MRNVCCWFGDDDIAAVVVCTVCPFWTIGTDSVPVSGSAFGSLVMVMLAMSGLDLYAVQIAVA